MTQGTDPKEMTARFLAWRRKQKDKPVFDYREEPERAMTPNEIDEWLEGLQWK